METISNHMACVFERRPCGFYLKVIRQLERLRKNLFELENLKRPRKLNFNSNSILSKFHPRTKPQLSNIKYVGWKYFNVWNNQARKVLICSKKRFWLDFGISLLTNLQLPAFMLFYSHYYLLLWAKILLWILFGLFLNWNKKPMAKMERIQVAISQECWTRGGTLTRPARSTTPPRPLWPPWSCRFSSRSDRPLTHRKTWNWCSGWDINFFDQEKSNWGDERGTSGVQAVREEGVHHEQVGQPGRHQIRHFWRGMHKQITGIFWKTFL